MTAAQPDTEDMDPSLRFDIHVLKLVPGDRVLLTMREEVDPPFLHGMVESLRERFVGVDFTIVAGVESVAYERHD